MNYVMAKAIYFAATVSSRKGTWVSQYARQGSGRGIYRCGCYHSLQLRIHRSRRNRRIRLNRRSQKNWKKQCRTSLVGKAHSLADLLECRSHQRQMFSFEIAKVVCRMWCRGESNDVDLYLLVQFRGKSCSL